MMPQILKVIITIGSNVSTPGASRLDSPYPLFPGTYLADADQIGHL